MPNGQKKGKKYLSGDGSRFGRGEGCPRSRKERIRIAQVMDRVRSIHVHVTDV